MSDFRSSERFDETTEAFDVVNAHDPRSIDVDGESTPYELAYARWLTDWVLKLQPDASEELLLATRAQHIARWTLSRQDYPEGLNGYLQWREDLKQIHAEKAGLLMKENGYSEEIVDLVQQFIRKDNFPDHPESRVLEDALCLVFIERQLEDFAETKPTEKTIDIIQKTWEKMTERAQDIAKNLELTPSAKSLLHQALSD